VGATPKEVAQRCDITFAMLSDPPAALEVATGPTGVAAGMSAGKGYVDVSTIDADTSRVIAAAVRGAGGMYLEAPVSGSKGPAEQGTLIFLTAGGWGDVAGYTLTCSLQGDFCTALQALLHVVPNRRGVGWQSSEQAGSAHQRRVVVCDQDACQAAAHSCACRILLLMHTATHFADALLLAPPDLLAGYLLQATRLCLRPLLRRWM
jgi:hypothetical protein